jgi:hypothetical protein
LLLLLSALATTSACTKAVFDADGGVTGQGGSANQRGGANGQDGGGGGGRAGSGGLGGGGAGGQVTGQGGGGAGGQATGQGGGGAGGGGGVGTDAGSGGSAIRDAGMDSASDIAPPIDAAPGITPILAGQIVVTELMHDTDVVADDFGEWFEVYNPDANITYDLGGCVISDHSSHTHTIALSVRVPPQSFRTFALFSTGGGFTPDYTYSGVKFSNSNMDGVDIICGGTIIDSFGYSVTCATKASGRSFSVDPSHYDAASNDANGNFCQGSNIYHSMAAVSDYGTPGAPNPPCVVPETCNGP